MSGDAFTAATDSIRGAAKQLQMLADSIDESMAKAQAGIHPIDAARDEVTVHASTTLSQVGDNYLEAQKVSTKSLRVFAKALAAQADELDRVDAEAFPQN